MGKFLFLQERALRAPSPGPLHWIRIHASASGWAISEYQSGPNESIEITSSQRPQKMVSTGAYSRVFFVLSQSLLHQVINSVAISGCITGPGMSRNPFFIRSSIPSATGGRRWQRNAHVAIPSSSGHLFRPLIKDKTLFDSEAKSQSLLHQVIYSVVFETET